MRWHSVGVDDSRIAVDIKTTIGDTRFDVSGRLVDPEDLRALDLRLALSGHDLAQLYTITGLPFPPTPAYNVDGRLQYADHVWSFTRVSGAVGRSDVAGDLRIDRRTARPFMRADLTSQRLDMRDLGGLSAACRKCPTRRDACCRIANTISTS
jgi:AsmA family protein